VKRYRLIVLSLGIAAVALGMAARLFNRPTEGPIVIYVIDTLRADRTSVFESARDTTPAARALALDAVAFTNAHALSTWTRPSIATLLTSLLPSASGALGRMGRLDDASWYLPHALQSAGWTTAAFVANGNLFDRRVGFQRGFGTFRAIVHPATGEFNATSHSVVEPVLGFIQAQTSSRFFLYVHVVDPHAPYRLEAPYRGLFKDTLDPRSRIPLNYDRAIRQADDQFGRVTAALKQKGFWKSSTIVYTADHGEEFREHGGAAHGETLYEEQIRIPLIIKFRDGDGRGTTRSDPVSLADIAPTIAEQFGLKPVSGWIGQSLWRRRLPDDREIYLTEDMGPNRLYALKRGAQKLTVRLYPTFSRTLFDLNRDPEEKDGRELSCGETTVDARIAGALTKWRMRDVTTFPSLRYDGGTNDAEKCDLTVDLSKIDRPFLTAEDYCAWGSKVKAGKLTIRHELTDLAIAADENGRFAPVTFQPGKNHCALQQVTAKLMEGPLSEEQLRNLRAVGYLR
jgi:arylsulfatase A-like enzyme